MNTKQKLKKTALVKAVRRDDPYLTLGAARVESDKFWRWGDDNLFPAALALMSRRSTTHRRIINDKADYISGKGFTFDPEVPCWAPSSRKSMDRANPCGRYAASCPSTSRSSATPSWKSSPTKSTRSWPSTIRTPRAAA